MTKSSRANHRWYTLTLAALTFTFIIGMPLMSMPVLFKEISEDLGLSLVQIGIVWGMASLAGVFVVLIGGVLSDRFGVKHTLSVACFLAGATGAMRGLSGDFITLMTTMFLFSLTATIIPVSLHKTCAIWFPERHLGLANSIVSLGAAVGSTIGAMISATILSPLLGGWRNVMFLYGVISAVIGIFWLVTPSGPAQFKSSVSKVTTVSFRQALSRVVRIRGVWLLGFILLGQIGCVQGMLGYLPLYLREIGWTVASADGALAVFNGASMILVVPIALLSDRLTSRKLVLLAATLITAIGVGLLSIASGSMVWVSVIIAGIVRDGFMAVIMTMIMEAEGVRVAYVGTALGLAMTLSRIGGVISPPIGNSLADINPGLPFIFWAILAAVALFSYYFVKETGRKQRTEITIPVAE